MTSLLYSPKVIKVEFFLTWNTEELIIIYYRKWNINYSLTEKLKLASCFNWNRNLNNLLTDTRWLPSSLPWGIETHITPQHDGFLHPSPRHWNPHYLLPRWLPSLKHRNLHHSSTEPWWLPLSLPWDIETCISPYHGRCLLLCPVRQQPPLLVTWVRETSIIPNLRRRSPSQRNLRRSRWRRWPCSGPRRWPWSS